MTGWPSILLTALEIDPLPPEGKARVMIVVLIAILISMIGLVGITLLRIIHHRSALRNENTATRSADKASPWTVAGERAEPVGEDGELRDG